MITPDEFDTLVRDTLGAVDASTRVDTHSAERLIANARGGVVEIAPRRRRVAWVAPLVAAAAVVVVALALVLVNGRSDHSTPPTTQVPTTSRPTSPAPTSPATKTPTNRATKVTQPPRIPGLVTADVSYLDARHGWALGDGRCPTGTKTTCAAILRTVDGGRTWHRTGIPAGLVSTRDSASCGDNGTITGACVDQIVFTTKKIGYLWSIHALYLTTDGGADWTDLKTQQVYEIVAVGNVAVRLTARDPCSAGCRYGVFAAPIGTTAWTQVIPYSKPSGDWQLAGASGVAYVLENLPSRSFSAASQALYRSTDGTRWTRVTTPWPCGKKAIDTITVRLGGALTATCY